MASDRDKRPRQRFEGEPRHDRPAPLAPGRLTLAGVLDPMPTDAAHALDTQIALATRRLAALEAAHRTGNHHASGIEAAGLREALRIGEQAIARVRVESEDRATALDGRLAILRELARPVLAAAFTPSPAALREAANGQGRAQWDREVAAWHAARGRVDLERAPSQRAPSSSGPGAQATDPARVPDATRNATAFAGAAPATAAPATAALQRKQDPAAQAGPWEHLFGQTSTLVNKLGRIQAPKGRTLLQRPDPGSAPSIPTPLPFDTLVTVVRRTTQPSAAERWCYVTAPDHGAAGFCEERYLAVDPPEPRARLHRIEGRATLGKIARDAYGEHITGGNDERLYVQGLYEANKDRAGVKLTPVELSWGETWHRKEAEEKTLEVYRGVQVLEGLSVWIPSHEFIQRLKASGAITTGSSELSKAWRAAAELADGTTEAVKYAAGFIVGLLEGAWSAIVDLFQGAAAVIEAVASTLYHLVTGNPGRIKDMLMTWVDKMRSAWEHRGQIADEFLKRWNAPSGWDRGQFHGEALGWVMMTVLVIIATAGAGAAANAGSLAARFPQVVQLLKTVDAVGDVTTYLGGAVQGLRAAGKLPEAAADLVKDKLGKTDRSAAAARDTTGNSGARARGIDGAEVPRIPGGPKESVSARKEAKNKPSMESIATPLDGGGSFKIDFIRDLSPKARGLVRKLEKQGFVRISEISAEDLVQISKWFDKEVAVVQTPYGRLRIILGERRGIITKSLKAGEIFVAHTHPVMRSKPDHFQVDLARAGNHIEAVIDWSGLVVYYNKASIKNPRNAGGWLEPLGGYEAAFMDKNKDIIGFARVDVIDGPAGTHIKVRE